MSGAPIPNPPLPLDFDVRKTEGTIVRQRRWIPMDDVDHRRHVEDAMLQPPVFFVNRQSGGVGFWLPDILWGRDHDVRINVSSHFVFLTANDLIYVRQCTSQWAMPIGSGRYPLEMRLMQGTLSHLLVS